MRVAAISAECEPWAKTGGLGDVVDALARALGKNGAVDAPVDVFLPNYRGVPVPDGAVSRPLTVPDPLSFGGATEVHLVEFEARGYRLRMVDHAPAFDRPGYYGDSKGDYPDNGWRFGLLCRAALEALRGDGRPLDVLHLHDWQAQPAAVLRDCAYASDPVIGAAAVMTTIHNLAYQGWIGRHGAAGLAFAHELARAVPADSDGILLLREGIERAEMVNTVSPGYAREVTAPALGMGMDGVLAGLGSRFVGILNGLDTQVWDPATDGALATTYSRDRLAGKAACRRALLTELGFDPADDGPVLGMIGRLDPQKGFDLLAGAAAGLVSAGARIVALGSGDPGLVRDLRSVAEKRPDAVAVIEAFDRDLSRRIYAGADMFLMPSRFEPCGQGQMIALRYGTPPVVHRTGGLADTVVDADEHPGAGTGFVFDEPTPDGLLAACELAMELFGRRQEWAALVDRGMAIDWSWAGGPAAEYVDAYRRAVELRRDRH